MGRASVAAGRCARRPCQSGESRSRLGRGARGWGTPAAGRADVGCAHARTEPAGRRPDLGRAAAAARLDATPSASRSRRRAATSAARSAQLGCDSSAAGAVVGCASPCRSSCAGATATTAPTTPTTGGRAATACADLGVAPSRTSATRRRACSFMGFRAAGRCSAQPDIHRLGSAGRECAARGAASAVVERARSGVLVGRAQDRRAGSSSGPVVGRAFERARGTTCGVSAVAG